MLFRSQPTLLVCEDLHWADPSTLEFLGLLLDQVPTTRFLILLTFRPDFIPSWATRSHLTSLTLNRLNRKQVETMIAQVAADKILSTEVIQQVVTKTDGVPLFVEELTKAVAESVGAIGRSPLQIIPATLQDSLMARLDRLGTVKEVGQLAATLGREFSYELLRAVSPLDEERLQQSLVRLVDAELLYQRGVPPNVTYLFKHALLQDAAYQSLLKSTRRQYHQQIAAVLKERFGEIKETQPELLAHHYTEASLIAQAIPYWQQAGQKAAQRSANVEAIAHLTKGLELLKTLPDTPDRAQQELPLQLALGAPLMAIKGYADPEVERVYTRTHELCRQVGETPQLFPVLWGLWVFYNSRAEFHKAYEIAQQCLTIAQRVHDTGLLLEANVALGGTLIWRGELIASRAHFEHGIALYDPLQHCTHAFVYGQDPGVWCRCFLVNNLWLLGYPDQALKRGQEALSLAQDLNHLHTLAFALTFSAGAHVLRGEWQLAQERTERLLALAAEQGFPYWLTVGNLVRGWILVEQGQGEEGIKQQRQSMATFRAIGSELNRVVRLGQLAEAYAKVGQIEEGLTVLAEAFALVNKTEGRFYEAELYRLRGELTLQKEARGWRLETSSPSPQASSL